MSAFIVLREDAIWVVNMRRCRERESEGLNVAELNPASALMKPVVLYIYAYIYRQ